jgi:hypothetical protein
VADVLLRPAQVHFILDEIVMGGMVLETSLKEIIKAVNGTVKYQRASKESVRTASSLTLPPSPLSGPEGICWLPPHHRPQQRSHSLLTAM